MPNKLRIRRVLVIVGIGAFLISSELMVFRSLNQFLDGFAHDMGTLAHRATVAVDVVSAALRLTAHPAARLYELYSWRQSNGVWSFSILPSPSGVNTPTDAVFNKKSVLNGVDALKRKISELPAGTKLLWLDRIASSQSSRAPGSTTLAYPPTAVVEQVKQYAQKKGVDVEILSANPFKS